MIEALDGVAEVDSHDLGVDEANIFTTLQPPIRA